MEIGDIVVSKKQKTIVKVISIGTDGTFNGIVINGGNSGLRKGDCRNNFISSCFKVVIKKEVE